MSRSDEEDRLQLRFDELEELYRGDPVGVCILDSELRFRRVSEHLASIHGLRVSDHLGRGLSEITPKTAVLLEPVAREVLRTGEPVLNVEIRGDTSSAASDEDRVWVASYHPFKRRPEVTDGVWVVVREVTGPLDG